MKVTNTTPDASKPFTPVHITFVFESEAELSAEGKLFNSVPVIEALEVLGASIGRAYDPFKGAGADFNVTRLNSILLAKLSQKL